MEPILQEDFVLAGVRVCPRLNQLVREGEAIRIPPKFMQVLCYLAARPGTVLSREALLDAVWPDTVVGEAVLTRAVSELRKYFDDDPRHPRVIETILKGGYRLIAPVTAHAPGGDSQWEDGAVAEVVLAPSMTQAGGASRRWIGVALTGGVVLLALVLLSRPGSPPAAPARPVDARPLTSYPGEEFDPALSPDGRQVAFAWGNKETRRVDLYVKAVDGGAPVALTEDAPVDARPTWSPDGRFLAFVRCDAPNNRVGLYTVPAAGGPLQELTEINVFSCMELPRLSWSPDGRLLAYVDVPDLTALVPRVYLLSLETLEKHPLTPPGDAHAEGTPVFSPDGREIAFTRGTPGAGMMNAGLDVYVMPVAGGEPRRITPGGFEIDGLDWHPDGRHVMFASRGNLWRVPATGGAPEWITAAGLGIVEPVMAREAPRMAYVQSAYEVNIWRMPVPDPGEGGEATPEAAPLIASTRVDSDPRIAPDGRRIAFTSDREGACALWVSDPDGSHALKLSELSGDCWNVNMLRWSPDGKNIAFVAYDQGQGDIFVQSAVGGPRRRLTGSPSRESAPGWSHDGKWVYFSSNRSGTTEVWKVPVTGGEAVPVTEGGGFAAFESPDGRWLYYTRPGEAGLWRRPVAGGAATRLLADLRPDDAMSWRAVEGGLYFITRSPRPAIAFFDPTSGETRTLAPLPPDLLACAQADVAPDGRWALFARIDRGERDLVLLDHFD